MAVEFGAFAVEFVGFAVEFIALALNFVALAIELDAFAIELGAFALEFVAFAQEFVMVKLATKTNCPSQNKSFLPWRMPLETAEDNWWLFYERTVKLISLFVSDHTHH